MLMVMVVLALRWSWRFVFGDKIREVAWRMADLRQQ